MAASPNLCCKVTYDWWQRIHTCHAHRNGLADWPQHLTDLFRKGVANIVGNSNPAAVPFAAAVAPFTEVYSKKSITLAVRPTPDEIDIVEYFASSTGYTKEQVVALFIRNGYSALC